MDKRKSPQFTALASRNDILLTNNVKIDMFLKWNSKIGLAKMTIELVPEKLSLRPKTRTPELLVVGGGKGGVGKTCFAVNVAVEVARRGWKVILVDADLSCSNVEAVLGVQCRTKLDEFFYQKGTKTLDNLLFPTPYENLILIPGTTGLLDVANPRYQQKTALIRELRTLEADLIVVDLDAGAHLNTLDFFLLAEGNGVLVIAPEKTSIDNAFKFLRASLFRRIERFYQSPELGVLLKRSESLKSFVDVLRQSDVFEYDDANRISGELIALARSMRPRIVVNRVVNAHEAHVAAMILKKLLRKDLFVEAEFLGFIYFDSYVSEAVNCGTPFVVRYPHRRISTCVSEIADKLGFFSS